MNNTTTVSQSKTERIETLVAMHTSVKAAGTVLKDAMEARGKASQALDAATVAFKANATAPAQYVALSEAALSLMVAASEHDKAFATFNDIQSKVRGIVTTSVMKGDL